MNSQSKAIRIAERVFRELKLRPGVSEKKVAGWIRKKLKEYGAQKESFRIIVASGRRSGKVHGFASRKLIREGEVVMVDFGALYRGFRSDITRTYILGKPSSLQKRIYSLLKRAQQAALLKIKAGVECRSVDQAARHIIEKAGFGRFFRHSTGHGIGHKTHQVPKISRKNRNQLKAGSVITIEPGIYLKKWGMRIEDMVKVTKNGHRLLTRVPK